jgi:V8-like Glu-specific endopeptidase
MTIRFTIPKIKFSFLFTLMAVMLGTTAGISGDTEIDMDGVLHLVGRHSVGHACPVAPHFALTAAHVTDPRWFDSDFNLIPYRFDNDRGDYGLAIPRGVMGEVDLGWVEVTPNPVEPYAVAEHAPAIGDKVYWIGYNIRKRKQAFETERYESEVQLVRAGHIFTKDSPQPGASGGCVFNASGEVVGIVVAGWGIGNPYKTNIGEAVGVWGEWMPSLPKKGKK